jgi:hypothetical protein|mmetsp:Transcript_27510/g.34183  ORF Transcript_27510/g.34183 Transcript_27510/m.34183 type:complete len:94 (-) Transcript_27510:185-466(-)
MRFTFYSAVSFAALLAQQTATAADVQVEDVNYDLNAQLENKPVYDEDVEFAQVKNDAESALGFSDDEEFDLAELNAELETLNEDGESADALYG